MTGSPIHVVSPFLRKRAPDRYGQRHPDENRKLIVSSLSLLEEEILKIPPDERTGLSEAEERFPRLAKSAEHRLMFLRCEMFNVNLAAIRLAKYWDKRIELFGDKAFSPLTLDGTLRNDDVALSIGFVRLLPGKDEAGRAILLGDPSRLDKTKYSRDSMVRATWYVLHAALEEESVQQKGVVFVINSRRATFRDFDQTLMNMHAQSVRGLLPVRIGAIHICHSSSFLKIVFPVIKMFFGERLKKRIHVHSGSDEAILDKLGDYGLPAESMPSDLSGGTYVDHEQWLTSRRLSGK